MIGRICRTGKIGRSAAALQKDGAITHKDPGLDFHRFGRDLGSSWESFGCFWLSLGRFLNVQNRTSFKHWPKMGSKRASGWILARFGKVLGGFGEGLWRDLKGFWTF